MTTTAWTGKTPLEEVDPDIQRLIREEKNRQVSGLELIASEVDVLCGGMSLESEI